MQRTSPVDRRANENLKGGFSGELPEIILLPAPIDSPFSGRHCNHVAHDYYVMLVFEPI